MRSFEVNLEMGKVAEEWAHDCLLRDRWAVTPLHDLPPSDGRGPRLSGLDDDLPVPDFHVAKFGHSLAVEVKAKEKRQWGRMLQCEEHGIDQRKWDAYRRYDSRVMPLFLLVVVVGPFPWDQRDPLCARVTQIRPHLNRDRSGVSMAYWPCSQMQADWLTMLNRSVNARDNRERRP
jgi:hypothetical protein